jgi:hypothetical protein
MAPVQEVPPEYNGFAYIYEGSGRIGDKDVQIQHAYVLANSGNQVGRELGREPFILGNRRVDGDAGKGWGWL